MRQLKKYGLCMMLAATLMLTAACGRNNTNNGAPAEDNMAGTAENGAATGDNVNIDDILFDTDGDGVYDHTDVDGDGLLEEIGMDANDVVNDVTGTGDSLVNGMDDTLDGGMDGGINGEGGGVTP